MKYLLTLVVFLIPSVVSAQVHECDQAPITSTVAVTGTTYKTRFCAKPADAPEAMTVYLNGVASDLRPITQVVPPSAVSGKAVYEGPKELQFPRGTHTMQITVWNKQYQPDGPSQESAKSNPLSVGAVDSLPPATAPVLIGVVK